LNVLVHLPVAGDDYRSHGYVPELLMWLIMEAVTAIVRSTDVQKYVGGTGE
jgi:hypothetical protein